VIINSNLREDFYELIIFVLIVSKNNR